MSIPLKPQQPKLTPWEPILTNFVKNFAIQYLSERELF